MGRDRHGAGRRGDKGEAVSLVGEARNAALRLGDVAVPGQVICTEDAHRLFHGRFRCASLGQKKIKGMPQSVELFQVEGIAWAGSLIEASAPTELSPLTGRDQETSLLKDRWEQAPEGMGQIVLLIGEPGLGKSRLVYTLKEHVLGGIVEGETDSPVIEWRCSPHFQNTGLYPAIDFFERALEFGREEPPQARFDRLVHYLEQYDWRGRRPCHCGRHCCRYRPRTASLRFRCPHPGSGKRPSGRWSSGCTRGPLSGRFCS